MPINNNNQTLSFGEIMAQLAEKVAKDDSHGYDQGARDGDGTTSTYKINDKDYSVHGGDFDCATLVDNVVSATGLTEYDSMTTFTEDEKLEAAGFTKLEYDPDKVQRGDILVRHGESEHTGIAVGNGKQVDASHGDDTDDPRFSYYQGDQDGTELLERPLQDSWQTIWRPPQPETPKKEQLQSIMDKAMSAFGTTNNQPDMRKSEPKTTSTQQQTIEMNR